MNAVAGYFSSLQKTISIVFVAIGLLLMVWFVGVAWPLDEAGFPGFIDSMLKLLAIVLVGMLLPRIATLEFGGAKLSLSENAVTLAESVNRVADRINQLEGAVQPRHMLALVEAPAAPLLPASTFPNDPQRGRFGGLAQREGFVLSARFPDREGGDLARVIIELSRIDGAVTAPVTFYLHDSFTPDTVVAHPVDGIARLELLIWGGFTVGAWPQESPSTLLELNLAKANGAPRIVRDR